MDINKCKLYDQYYNMEDGNGYCETSEAQTDCKQYCHSCREYSLQIKKFDSEIFNR